MLTLSDHTAILGLASAANFGVSWLRAIATKATANLETEIGRIRIMADEALGAGDTGREAKLIQIVLAADKRRAGLIGLGDLYVKVLYAFAFVAAALVVAAFYFPMFAMPWLPWALIDATLFAPPLLANAHVSLWTRRIIAAFRKDLSEADG